MRFVPMSFFAEAQKMGGEVAYIDAEHAMDPTYAQALGIPMPSPLRISSGSRSPFSK